MVSNRRWFHIWSRRGGQAAALAFAFASLSSPMAQPADAFRHSVGLERVAGSDIARFRAERPKKRYSVTVPIGKPKPALPISAWAFSLP